MLDFWICEASMAFTSSGTRLYLKYSQGKKCSKEKHIATSPTCHAWEPTVHDIGTMVEAYSILVLQITEFHSEVRSYRKPVATRGIPAMCQVLSHCHVSFFLSSLLLLAHCTLSGNEGSRASTMSQDEGVIKYSPWRKGLYLGPLCISSINGAQHLANSRDTSTDWVNACPADICFISLCPGDHVMQFPNTSVCHSHNNPRKLLQFLIPNLEMEKLSYQEELGLDEVVWLQSSF